MKEPDNIIDVLSGFLVGDIGIDTSDVSDSEIEVLADLLSETVAHTYDNSSFKSYITLYHVFYPILVCEPTDKRVHSYTKRMGPTYRSRILTAARVIDLWTLCHSNLSESDFDNVF